MSRGLVAEGTRVHAVFEDLQQPLRHDLLFAVLQAHHDEVDLVGEVAHTDVYWRVAVEQALADLRRRGS